MNRQMRIMKVALQGNIANLSMETIPNTLKAKQNVVGGLIEVFRIGYVKTKPAHKERLKELELILNEEGKLVNLPVTCVLDSKFYREPIAGSCFFCLADNETGEFEGLPLSLYNHLEEIIKANCYPVFDLQQGHEVLLIDTDKINELTGGCVYE